MKTRPARLADAVNRPMERDELTALLLEMQLPASDNIVDFLTETVRAAATTADYLISAGRRSNGGPATRMAYVVDTLWESFEPLTHTRSETLNWVDHSIMTLSAFNPSPEDLSGKGATRVTPISLLDRIDVQFGTRPVATRPLIDAGRQIRHHTGYRSRQNASRARKPWDAINELNSVETVEGIEVLQQVAGDALDLSIVAHLLETDNKFERAVTGWIQEQRAALTPAPQRTDASLPSAAMPRLASPRQEAALEFARFDTTKHADENDTRGQVAVWYGTDRAPTHEEPSSGFDNRPSTPRTVHYGRCLVNVPQGHKFGSIGNSWWDRHVRRADDERMKLDAILPFDDGASGFAASINIALEGLAHDERCALVYVHGYNVAFEEAAIRAAQLAFDLRIEGPTSFYSWPSAARAHKYTYDVDNIGASEPSFAQFLRVLATQTDVSQVNLIVHSMGNRLVARTLHSLSAELRSAKITLGHIVLAAPDINTDLFHNLAAVYPQISTSATMYVSERDKALAASHILWDSPRAGFTPPVTVVPGVQTIEVTDIDVSRLGHGYYAAAHPVLYDIRAIFSGVIDPAKRLRLGAAANSQGTYWQLNQ